MAPLPESCAHAVQSSDNKSKKSTRADIYGYVVPFCLELMKLMEEYQIPIKVRACDTMGYGVNYPGAVIPRSVQGIIYALHTHAGVDRKSVV